MRIALFCVCVGLTGCQMLQQWPQPLLRSMTLKNAPHSALILPGGHKYFSSNHHGALPAAALQFCETVDIADSQVPLRLELDCQLPESVRQQLRQGFEREHRHVVRLWNQMVPEPSMQLRLPVRLQLFDATISQAAVYPVTKELVFQYPVDWRKANHEPNLHLYNSVAEGSYATLVHENFHLQVSTFGSMFNLPGDKAPYKNVYHNELTAYWLEQLLGHVMDLLDGDVNLYEASLIFEPVLKDSLVKGCQQARFSDFKTLVGKATNRPTRWFNQSAPSVTAMYLTKLHQQQLGIHQNMLPLYLPTIMAPLAEAGAGYRAWQQQLQPCQVNRLTDSFVKKHELYDYPLQASDREVPWQAPAPLQPLLLAMQNKQLPSQDVFGWCRHQALPSELRRQCTANVLDILNLQLQPLPDSSPLPEEALDFKDRWQQLTTQYQHTPVPSAQPVQYRQAADGFYRNPLAQIADTAASVNVDPVTDDCPLQGEQQVRRLNGQLSRLTRCRFEPSRGEIWQLPEQRDHVNGLPSLIRQQALLTQIEQQLSLTDAKAFPFVVVQGMPLFQLYQQHARLNLCLDTGSVDSFITPRYAKRFGLSMPELAKKLETTASHADGVKRLQIELQRNPVLVKMLGHSGFPYCDLIVGTDLLGMYQAVQFDVKQLFLWPKNTGKTLNQAGLQAR